MFAGACRKHGVGQAMGFIVGDTITASIKSSLALLNWKDYNISQMPSTFDESLYKFTVTDEHAGRLAEVLKISPEEAMELLTVK